MQKLTNEQIEVAVKWWADAMEHPKFDNGDDSSSGGMSMMLATIAHKSPTKEQLEAFKKSLAEELLTNENIAQWGLSCDYGPDKTLADTLKKVGMDISITSVPWKTNMNFSGGGVSVSCGYGAEYVKLYPNKTIKKEKDCGD